MSTRAENLALFRQVQQEVAAEYAAAADRKTQRAQALSDAFQPIRQAWEDVRSTNVAIMRKYPDRYGDYPTPLDASLSACCRLILDELHVISYLARYNLETDQVEYVRLAQQFGSYAEQGMDAKTDPTICADAEELIRRMYRDIAEHQAG